jgi:hypothetical protein
MKKIAGSILFLLYVAVVGQSQDLAGPSQGPVTIKGPTQLMVYQPGTFIATLSGNYTGPFEVHWYANGYEHFSYVSNDKTWYQTFSWASPTGNYVMVRVLKDGTMIGLAEMMLQINSQVSSGQLELNKQMLTWHLYPGDPTLMQSFTVSNSGIGMMPWSLSGMPSWLVCSPTTGYGKKVVNVAIESNLLQPGIHKGAITVTASSSGGSPQTVAVTVYKYAQGTSEVPFGGFATPVDGTTVFGSIPVTGWALDDTGIEAVKIYNGSTYLGDAVFVEGARPDVEEAYPDYPNNTEAGWGYMMLTNFLPGGGNGTYTIYAIATDRDGNTVTLGSKTIYCDNAHAVKPFGAIDTPSAGGAAFGREFVNWGWVLTPQPNRVPTDGSTIAVWVDGINLGHPHYNIYRADIASLFPGYNNSNGAVGYFYLDTTKYQSGIHTIQWTATDNVGNSDGIGSRFFSINNSSSAPDDIDADCSSPEPQSDFPDDEIAGDALPREFAIVDPAKALIKLELAPYFTSSAGAYSGFTRLGSTLKSLPIGSTLNTTNGTFTWQPGPSLLGKFMLEFRKLIDGQIHSCTITYTLGDIKPEAPRRPRRHLHP